MGIYLGIGEDGQLGCWGRCCGPSGSHEGSHMDQKHGFNHKASPTVDS